MDVRDIRNARTDCEQNIRALLVELEQKTDVFVHYFDFDRLEAIPTGVGPIVKVNISLGLDES